MRLPGVHDCAVFGIPDDEFGEALMAVVEPQPGVTLDVAAIRAQLKASLADYKVPKHVEIQAQPAARRFRQDLQAPPARSLLGAGGAEDLRLSRGSRVPRERREPSSRSVVRCRHGCPVPFADARPVAMRSRRSGPRSARPVASPLSLSCTAAKKLRLRSAGQFLEQLHVIPDHAFRTRPARQSRRRDRRP